MDEKIIKLYKSGKRQIDISNELNIPYTTVKSIISRKFRKEIEKETIIDENIKRCKYCGEPVNEVKGKKEKIFCSPCCRLRYWRAHHGK